MNGVVFDFDGVLADSEPISWQAWRDVLAFHDLELTTSDVAACTGTTSRDTYEHLGRDRRLPPFDEVLTAVDEARRSRYATELRAFEDAAGAARGLAMAGIPLAVASSSSRCNLDLKLDVLGLGRYFEVTVAGDEVANGKPAPDLYRVAVERLGIEAASSVAIEDSVVGADAAVAAGLRVIVVDRNGTAAGVHPTVSAVDADLLLLWLGR